MICKREGIDLSRKFSLLFTILAVASLLAAVGVNPAVGSNSGGSGQDRWVHLDNGETEKYNVDANLTVPETISENFTFEGNLTYEDLNGTSDDEVTTWVNITVNGTTFSSGGVTQSSNETVNIEIDAEDLKVNENVSIEARLETDTGLTDSWSGYVEVISDTNYLFSVWMVNFIVELIPIFVILGFLIPLISKIANIGDEI